VALDSAIHNFSIYGNLELTPEKLEDAYNLEDGGQSYYKMLEDRSRQSPYCDRAVDVAVHLSEGVARCVLRHDGPGLDRKIWAEASDPGELEGGRARGWLLVKSFMDEVTFNSAGTEVVLVRRFK
jgi:hypothetical protein